jgi:hypothetical protein
VGGSASETEAEASLSLLPGDARAVTGKIKERIVDTSILSLNEGGKKIVDCRKLQSVELIYWNTVKIVRLSTGCETSVFNDTFQLLKETH